MAKRAGKKTAKRATTKKASVRRAVPAATRGRVKQAPRKAGTPRKPAARRRKRPAPAGQGKGLAQNPTPVTTGSGPSALEIGTDLVAMFNRGDLREIEAKYWSADIVSVEGLGVHMAWQGEPAVRAKNDGWSATNVIHGASAEGPFVGSSGFAVRFRIDSEERATGQRRIVDEIAVYTVRDGKIVREEFMYAM